MNCLLVFAFFSMVAPLARGQAPSLLWDANVNGSLFAIDAQTNTYVNTGGAVKIVSPSGALLSSNLICPVTMRSPTVARRDGAGNYWFFGTFDGTSDFGGVVLVGGWTNNPLTGHWTAGYPTCFLANYSSNGVLQFVTSFGHQAQQHTNYDLALDPAGGAYVSFHSQDQTSYYSHFTGAGSNDWQVTIPGAYGFAGTLDGVTASNCCGFEYVLGPFVNAGRLSRAGSYADFNIPETMGFSSSYAYNGRAVLDDAGRVFQAGICHLNCAGAVVLRKVALDGTEAWEVGIGTEEQFTLARDPAGHVYLGGVTGTFSQYSTDGAFIWSTNYSQVVTRMLVDNAGTRFLNFADGSLARLSDGFAPQLPVLANGPLSQTVFVGDPVNLSVTASGTLPITYAWKQNVTNPLGPTSNTLAISSAATYNAGTYTVVASNPAGAVTSTPAVVIVKQVELYHGSQLLTNGDYVFPIPPTLSVHSAFSGGAIYYTLDGSKPDFSSISYAGPFVLSNSATVKAIGYSADFAQSELADAINVTVLPYHTLVASSTGGGSVTLNPSGGTYASTNIVTATAIPASGWSFLGWQGDADGTTPSFNVSMERDKSILAVFGTTLSTTAVGGGQVQLDPPVGPYPYGTVVRVTGVPQPGNYLGAWGNAASGNNNPLYFTISAPTQTISSIFGTLAGNQAALTVLISGSGAVSANPHANVFTTNQSVVLTATPASGQLFVNWTGDANGAANPLTLPMTQSRIVTANFSPPGLFVNPGSGDGMISNGFQFTLISLPQTAWQIFASSNLSAWESLGLITNTQGVCHYFDPAASNAVRYYKAVAP